MVGNDLHFAVELARRHCNVCLISRSEDRLRDCMVEEQVNPNVKVACVVADFRRAHDHIHRHTPSYDTTHTTLEYILYILRMYI